MKASSLVRLLRWSETYTKTDMVYLASSGFWLNLNLLVITVLSLLLSIAFANLLPAETYGMYQYLFSFATILTALTLTGMNTAVTQGVARGHEGMLRASVRLQLTWSLLPFLLGAGVGAYYLLKGNLPLGIGLLLIAVFIPLSQSFNTYIAFLNGKKAFRQAFAYGLILNIAYYGSMFLAVLFLKDALFLLFVNVFVNAVIAIILYIWTLKKYRPNASTDPAGLAYGKHLSALYVPTLAIRQIDAILVFQVLGPVQLAVYTFASTVPERIAGFFRFAFTATLPKFATQSREAIQSSLLSKMAYMTVAGIGVAVLYILCAPYIFALLFPAYLEAVTYSQLYALLIITAAGNLSTSALLSQKLKGELYLFYTIGPAIQLVLQIALLVLYGLWGLIIARILSSVVDTLFSLGLFYWNKGRAS